jgi:hypothetical protein
MIKFGISESYIPNWGVVQAIREIYQNFIDYGEFDVHIEEISEGYSCVRISNDFSPESWEFLKLGFSQKKDGSIGKHGEGLKLAGLIFMRNKKQFRITTPIGRAKAALYEDDNLGSCYGLELDDMTSEIDDMTSNKFEIYFEADTKDIEVFKEGYIQKEDVLMTSGYGNIVDKTAGNIYVGGLYVCKIKDLKYSIDFKPCFIELGRDREVPSSYDLEYWTNQIVISCGDKLDFKASDIHNMEFKQGGFPKKLAEKFKPVISSEGHLQLKSGSTVITDQNMINKISKNATVAKRIEKIRYTVVLKSNKSPSSVLKGYQKKLYLSTKQNIMFESIIKLSKGWKQK